MDCFSIFIALFIFCSCAPAHKEQITDTIQVIPEIIEETTNNFSKTDSIVNVINEEGKDISEFPMLRKNVELGDHLKIYCQDEESGGTRGVTHHPIVQWMNEGKPKAASLSAFIECEFNRIIELDTKEKLYLLLGSERESGDCTEQIAYVIKINGDKIDLRYPAFGGIPYLNLCWGAFTFKGKILHYKLRPDDIQENLQEVLRYKSRYREFAENETSAVKIYDAVEKDYYSKRTFRLTFDGSVFIE